MHKYLPNLFIFLDQYNNQIFKNNNTKIGIIYRNYNDPKRETELIKLALKVRADGIYIPSFNKTKKFLNLEKKNLTILGSAHNQKEIREKISQKCQAIFLSPIFYVEKSINFLNVYKFNSLSRSNKVNILALGGITEHNVHKLRLLHTKGFGGIGIFKKKPALKRPVFLKNNFF